jgi:hypothetical protein
MGGIDQLKCSGGQVTSSLSACLWRAAARAVRIGRSRRYDPVEVERFIGDLSRATRRLVSREYRQSSFTPRNLLRIPERTEELFFAPARRHPGGVAAAPLLAQLQEQLADRDAAMPLTLPPDDSSLEFHPCPGPLRQVEIVRDRLLQW